jgi:hypothetical protein
MPPADVSALRDVRGCGGQPAAHSSAGAVAPTNVPCKQVKVRSDVHRRVALGTSPKSNEDALSQISGTTTPSIPIDDAQERVGIKKPALDGGFTTLPPASWRGRSHQPLRAVLGDPIPVHRILPLSSRSDQAQGTFRPWTGRFLEATPL